MAGFSKWAVLDSEYTDPEDGAVRKVMDPHAGQLSIMEDPVRMKICPCGRRFGKSNLGGHELLVEAIRALRAKSALKAASRRLEYWIVGPEYADSEKEFRVFYDKATKLGMEFDRPGTYYSVATGDMVVSLWDGAFILQAKSEGRPTSLVGEALSGVIMAEAAKMKEDTWTKLIRAALADTEGWALFTSTPEGKNWFYRMYLDAINANNPGWSGYRMPSWKNPMVFTKTGRKIAKGELPMGTPIPPGEMTIDAHVARLMHLMNDHPEYTAFEIITKEGLIIDAEIAQMANDLTIPMFQQEVAADFTDFVGKVFKEYDEETHSRLLPFNTDGNWQTIAAVDYGYRNPNVWLLIQIGPWGEINVIDELYQENLTPEEFGNEVIRRGLCPDSCTEFFPDPSLPGYTATLENVFRRAGKRVRARAHTGGELVDRLNLIRLALKQRINDTELNAPQWKNHPPTQDIKRPRLMISTRCPHMLHEMGEYRYPEKKDENAETSIKRYELPLKKDDHTPEALGRFLAGRYYSVQSQFGGGTRITQANFLNGLGGSHPGGYGPEPAGIATRRTSKSRQDWIPSS